MNWGWRPFEQSSDEYERIERQREMRRVGCEHENLSDSRMTCDDCGMVFVACRGCYVEGSGLPVYHEEPECPITDDEWERIRQRELAA